MCWSCTNILTGESVTRFIKANLTRVISRVEEIASEMPIKPSFSGLRNVINDLQSASADLDEEKEEAEEDFRDLLRQLPDKHKHCRRHKFRRIAEWIKRLFGVQPRDEHHPGHDFWMDVAFGNAQLQGDTRYHSLARKPSLPQQQSRHHSSGIPIRKFIKAAKRVRNANRKLAAFERGFISEGGIKDREWYKHLGVAPGLWLGKFSYLCHLLFTRIDGLANVNRIRCHYLTWVNGGSLHSQECYIG